MKTYYSILLAAIASGALAQGAATAYTTPVGYITTACAENADTFVANPLLRASEYAGLVGSITGDEVTLTSPSVIIANQFVYLDAAQTNATKTNTYMLRVTSGALVGRFFKVLSNTTTTNTLDPDALNTVSDQGLLAGSSFEVLPYWTMNTLYPNGDGIGSTGNFFSPVNVVYIFDSRDLQVDRAASNSYFHYTGDESNPAGWYTSGLATANDDPISPAYGIMVRNQTASPLSLVQSGTVKSSAAAVVVDEFASDSNDTFAQVQSPINVTLNDSGLASNNVVRASTNFFSPLDVVYVWDSPTEFDPAATAGYFYFAGDIDNPVGWYSTGLSPAGTDLLKAGASIMIRKAPGTDTVRVWTSPKSY